MTVFDENQKNFARVSSKIENKKLISSNGLDFSGNNFDSVLKSVKTDKTGSDKKNDDKKENLREVLKLRYPNNAYGLEKIPESENVLYKNVTIWTNEKEGIIQNTDLLVKDGKISLIGKDLDVKNVKIIDGAGKHLTSGIIDEHSHIAASSINEGGQNSSAEVTIEGTAGVTVTKEQFTGNNSDTVFTLATTTTTNNINIFILIITYTTIKII